MAAGSWSLVEELFARGDTAFVDELRRVHDAERLGSFAARWFAAPRPFAREAILDYLAQPLNCYRHEPLIKRLFKLAEKAGDNPIMGAFLVAFDRSVRRVRKTVTRYKHENFPSQAAAEVVVRKWEAEGYENGRVNNWSNNFYATATKSEPVVATPGNTTMPRPAERDRKKDQKINDNVRQRFEKRFTLFSLPTRRYLRRRAWRYFRNLGKRDPTLYVKWAAAALLSRYTDEDADSDIHLLDCWGLTHALFHHSPALISTAKGWTFAPGKSLADLAPAPMFESAWIADPDVVYVVILMAKARAIRQWAVWMLRTHHESWLAAQPVTTLLELADFEDPAVSSLGFDLLEKAADLAEVPVAEWLTRLNGDDLAKLQRLSDLLIRRLDPARVSAADALNLAAYRSKPVAELGLAILTRKTFAAEDVTALLPLVQADCDAVRPGLILWLRGTLSAFGPVQPEWILEFLDSKHLDVRTAGWAWLNESTLRDEPAIWHKLVESPYDDIRSRVVAALTERTRGADADADRLLWATVLLNVVRGGRQKPGVVARVVSRIAEQPQEMEQLMPLLAVALRSLRGPEFRAGLLGVVQLAEKKPDLLPAIRQRFPELEM